MIISLVSLTACSSNFRDYTPNHVSLTPSVEWEIQHGSSTKTKPRIQSTMDWNF
jgi:hypothetical protein